MSDVINVKIIGDLAYVNGVTDAAEKAATDAKQAATDAENFLAQMKLLPADLEILNQGNSLGTGVDSLNFKGSGVVASKLQDGVFEVTVTASGGGSSDSAEDIRDKLESLAAGQRLDADHVDETTNRKFMSDLDKAKMDKVVTKASESPEDDHVAVWAGGELKAGPSMDGGASSLVKLDGTGKLPAIDGSQLTNLPLVDYSVKDVKFEGNNIVFEFNDGSRVVLNNAKLDLKGDKGDAGAKGDAGDKGDTGPAGADGVGGYADKGALDAGDDPQAMEAGFYYVTEKFIGAPTIASGYVGHMMIQDKIDDPNGRLLVYFTSAGIYYQQKFAGGWEAWLNTATAGFRPAAPVRAFTKFAGIYQNLSELNTFVTNPQAGEQAILLDPDDAYFQYSNGAWSKLASVSDVHELYLGIFATQSELDGNHASPDEGSLAIVGDGFKYFTGGKWVDYENHDIVGLTTRMNVAEQHLQTLQQDNLKQDGEIKTLQDDKIEGVTIGDGANASRDVKRILFNGHQAFGTGDTAEIHLEFAHFKTIAERDTWTATFASHMDYDLIAVVDSGSKGSVQWYKFDAAIKSWSDYDFAGITGITLTDKENTEWSPVNNISFPQAEFNQVGQKTQITFPDSSFTLSVKDEAGTDTLGIDTLVFESSIVEPDNLDSKEVRVKPYMEFTSTSVSEEPQVNSVKANTVSVSYPLEVSAGPNAELDAVVALAHGSIEMGHAPAYLAYAHSEIAVVGKEGLSAHHDGAVWFTDSVYPSNAFMSVDKPAKTISIQEADTLDPNVTGGTDYLIAFRIHMQGNAPDDGRVRIYLWDTIKNTYLVDVNGDPMGSQRLYKQGEELGFISVIGVVNAKGSTTFTTHVMDDFVDDELIISSRTEGASGILVQALTSDEKTSPALLQFEQDTNQQIDFDSKYYGPNLITLDWMLQEDSPEFTAQAGSIKGLNDGSLLYAIGQTKMSIADKTLSLVTADFNLGKFINQDDTHLIKGKTIKAYTTMANPDGDIVMAMFEWVGKPGEATTKIYDSRSQGGGIVPLAGWEQVEEDVIVANALGDFKEYSHNFTVPDDAVELAIILYPSLGLTTDSIHIKGFNADVLNPFMGYIVKAPELYTEQHLKYDPQYAKLVQDRQGYASLRYTLNNTPASGVPMPVGMIKAGKANITIDDSVNVVVGSAARGGEGAIKFGDEGRIVVKTELYIYPGESLPKGNKATARFWYASVSDDGQAFTKIDDSETSFLVTGGDLPSKCKMNPFGMDVKTGDRIVLLSLTDATDDAYIISNFTSTMLTTEINFEEIVAQGYDDTDLINAPIPKANVIDRRVYSFTGNAQQNVVIDIDIPVDVELAEIEAIKTSGTTRTSIKDCEYSYDSSTKKLTVHVGNGVADGRIHLTFWSGIA